MNRVFIVSQSGETESIIEQTLRNCGCAKPVVISSGSEARRMIKNDAEPDLIIINSPLTDEFGQEIAEIAAESTSAGIIMLCLNDIADDIADKVSDYGITVVSKPLNRQLFERAVKLVDANRLRMLGLKKENDELLSRIDEMRLINRAKSTLMKYLKFTEPQAHKYIEKQAMNTRQTRKEVAMRILATYER